MKNVYFSIKTVSRKWEIQYSYANVFLRTALKNTMANVSRALKDRGREGKSKHGDLTRISFTSLYKDPLDICGSFCKNKAFVKQNIV